MDDVTRRSFLKSSGVVAAATTVRLKTGVAAQGRGGVVAPAPRTTLTLTVNGQLHRRGRARGPRRGRPRG